jgi:hypothetical protein
MNKELTGISLDGHDIETLKIYCRSGDVIVERIPRVCGISFTFWFFRDFSKPLYLRGMMKNIFWFHWSVTKEYCHETGKIVYVGCLKV